MSVVINTNYAAQVASNNLAYSNVMLQDSLNRLSSGSKIVNSSDDAGGLAVSMKLSATINRDSATSNNLGDAVSYLQTQDGGLSVVGSILNRISELDVLYQDPTKNSSDLANYQSEFAQLQSELTAVGGSQFNGVNLFGSSSLTVDTTDDMSTASAVSVAQANLLGGSGLPTTFTGMDAANWDPTSTGTGTATPGDTVTFSDGASGEGSLTSKATFSGATTIQFHIDSGDAQVEMNGTYLNGFIGFGGSTIKLVLDGAGNMETFVDGSSIGSTSGTPTSGQLKLHAVPVDEGGSGVGTISNFSVTDAGSGGGGSGNVSAVANATNIGALSLSTITAAIQDVATMRANNGATQSRLNFASQLLTTNQTNLTAANSRISDVDVAAETSNLARFNVLVQAGTAMLTQANQSAQIALKLITGA